MRLVFLVLLICVFMAGCAVQKPPKPGDIYSGAGWRAASQTMVDDRIKSTRVVLVGERHANPDDHRLQLNILKIMADENPGLVVGVEWLESDAQTYCDRLSQGELTTSEFAAEVEWTRKWGHNFEAYEPIFAEIKARKLKLVALNAPVEIIRKINRKGIKSLSAQERDELPPAMRLDDPEYLRLISDQFKGHGISSPEAEKRFLAAQIARDETMAYRFALALSPWPESGRHGLLFVGRGHLEQNLGLTPRLERRLPGLDKLVVLPVSDQEAHAFKSAGQEPSAGQIWYVTQKPKPRQRGRLGLVLKKTDAGLHIIHVRENSPAAKAGLKVGDTLVSLDGQSLKSAMAIHNAIKDAPFEPHGYSILRDGKIITIQITLPKE